MEEGGGEREGEGIEGGGGEREGEGIEDGGGEEDGARRRFFDWRARA